MKFLNLDDIAVDSARTVRYAGETYAVRDFNVEEFIAFQKHFGDFRKYYDSAEPADMPKVVDSAIELTKIGVPTFPSEQVRKLNPLQLLALVSMIANLLPEPDAETSEVIEEKKDPAPEATAE